MRRTLILVSAIAALSLSALMHAATSATVADAAMQGNHDAVKALLKEGADVNTAQGDGMTALHWAVQKGDVDLTKTLLYAGANVKATTRIGGYSPLLIASRNGNAAMIETLLAGGADPNSATVNGTTALMFAAQAGNVAAVRTLLDRNADVNAREKVKGETALMVAAAYGRADVIRALMAKGADAGITTRSMDLAAFNKEEQERFLMFQQQQAAQAAGRGGRSGAEPAQQGQGGRRGFNPNAKPGIERQYNYTELVAYWGGITALHLAARQGEVDAVKALLEGGAPIDVRAVGDNSTPLVVATINGYFEGALPAAARLRAAAHDVSRSHHGAARQGRGSERAAHEEGVVLAIRFRSVGCGRNRGDAVLARRLRR
jgi:ankyrin repeat protein